MAAQCKPHQPGFDQIFTIYLKRDSDDLKENNVSFCGIQVKNRQTDINLEGDNFKYTDLYAGVKIPEEDPYLTLFMNLNSTQTSISTRPLLETITTRSSSSQTDSWRASIVFHGLYSFVCLGRGVIDALKELINTEPDFLELKSKESGKRYTKMVNPCLYPDE